MTQLEVENSKRLLPSTIVATTGKPTGITLNCSSDADITASIELEDGTAFGHFALLPNLNSGKPDLTIAPDLPMGYHTLTVTVDGREGKAAIIAAPARIPVPEAVAEHQRWGWMTQMYSVRSRESWGIGDYGRSGSVFWQMPPRSPRPTSCSSIRFTPARRFRRLSHRRIYRNRADSST